MNEDLTLIIPMLGDHVCTEQDVKDMLSAGQREAAKRGRVLDGDLRYDGLWEPDAEYQEAVAAGVTFHRYLVNTVPVESEPSTGR